MSHPMTDHLFATTAGTLLLVLLAFLSKTYSSPQVPPPVDPAAAQLTAVLTQQQIAWNQGDIPTFMKGYWHSPELTFSGSTGVSRGWEAVRARYQRTYSTQATMGHLEFSDLEVRSLGSTSALVLGKWQLTRSSGNIGGVFTLIFQRFSDGWKIIHDHTSSVEVKP
jgi:ketosteroid isomerase-like protein